MKFALGAQGFLLLRGNDSKVDGYAVEGVSFPGREMEPGRATFNVIAETRSIPRRAWIKVEAVDPQLSGSPLPTGVRSGEGAVVSHLIKSVYLPPGEVGKILKLPRTRRGFRRA